MNHQFISRHQIGDEVVVLNNHYGVVEAVRFTESKVTYDVALDVGGEALRDVDSTFVEALADEFDDFKPLAPVFGPGGAVRLDNAVKAPRTFKDILRDAGFDVTEPATRDPFYSLRSPSYLRPTLFGSVR